MSQSSPSASSPSASSPSASSPSASSSASQPIHHIVPETPIQGPSQQPITPLVLSPEVIVEGTPPTTIPRPSQLVVQGAMSPRVLSFHSSNGNGSNGGRRKSKSKSKSKFTSKKSKKSKSKRKSNKHKVQNKKTRRSRYY
jgi:hypothetical protein